MFLINGSILKMNKIQLSASPCFTPFLILYDPALDPFSRMSTNWFLYSKSKVFVNSCSPSFCKIALMYQCSTESNAFSASNETSILSVLDLTDSSIICSIWCRLSVICLPGM